ncbi:hypothetical protein ILUMI_06812 [Ignelater luminosus]|uniref:RAB6-interacting golgin n=1 Tax=Ignelater luminosus TaxID=2038154 RepID=A0A8K0GGW0_IGNLU|nr:hypothetical protein ILUMI_06812 [Ignelater luminosus]
MSGSFTGFSEEDIKKLNNKNPTQRKPQATGDSKLKSKAPRRATNENSHQNHGNDLRNKVLNEKIKNSPAEPILESAKLNKVIEPPPPPPPPPLPTTPDHPKDILDSPATTAIKNDSKVPESNKDKNEVTFLSERKIDLDEFQARQKLIEEQNRKKKELLMKALAAKTKQTQEEAQRLNEVREEFKKLDALLSTDVKILRKQIELASLDYMEAQKRYYRIEREFLDAKLYLHQKLEKKEMLTEHLCAIIEKNEERKAEKLNELLSKLNLKTDIHNDSLEQIDNNLKSTNSSVQTTNSTDSKN